MSKAKKKFSLRRYEIIKLKLKILKAKIKMQRKRKKRDSGGSATVMSHKAEAHRGGGESSVLSKGGRLGGP